MKLTNSDLLLKYLENEGVEYIFGVPGLSLIPLFEAINRNNKIKPILAKHEEGAAFMADGYARVKGTLGACYATSGPGATNLITGVANAFVDNVPILVLTGQVATSSYGGGAFQDSTKEGVDSVLMFDPITRHSSMVISKYRAPDQIREALRIALTGKRGPVHLSLPKDIMAETIDTELPTSTSYRPPAEYFDRRMVIETAQELVNAKNPVILVGTGAVTSKACDDIKDLAETLSIPVATTPKAKGAFPEDHPLSLGVLGFCGSPVAEKCLTSGQTDVLLVIGASLNQITTLSWDPRLAPTKCLIHVNIDPTEIGKNYKVDIPLVGDAKTIVNEISFRIMRFMVEGKRQEIDGAKRVAQIRQEVGMFIEPDKVTSDAVPVKPQRMVKELERALPEDAILFVDTGNPVGWAIHYMQIRRPDSFICPFGLLTMGYSTAAAIGGKLAAPDRPVVSLVGDGCFLMNGMEIATAVSYDIPVVWIVQNNAKLGLVHEMQKMSLGEKTVTTTFKPIDAAKVAEGLGAKGYRISKPGELEALLPKVIKLNEPAVIDCTISDEVPPLTPFVEGLKSFSSRLDMM
ncbi:MAG: thiamine pyrophosphate-binding protein [Candidatus Bathyarchaeota archaeon]|nr:thiamine pyrophosphate-binding protein [Candidatus Bathyarchaeota archaeon]MDD4325710.1 thiamine pyrophosphate-binding protein [Candidatus Bathyarchaeota archaeon]MDI9578792.1 thiamine pyrophosphate-binding protein [Thermoproteota archaeon]MDT8781070.1 thiamine pyrophosphate-binding protein [Candidatus Bathyarchaeota archaeon]NLD65674.1 thiamine pyrophosphate-binding protein [Thermoproteota archaeon]